MVLEIKDITFNRGEDGNLIPQEVILEDLEDKPTIVIIPLTRGKLLEIYSKATEGTQQEKIEADNEIIKEGLIKPEMNNSQINDLKPQFATAVSTAIIAVSLGITQKEVLTQAENILSEKELELKKK